MVIFGEKSVIGPEKNFSPSDLLDHVELLLKVSKSNQRRYGAHYSWLQSRDVHDLDSVNMSQGIAELRPMVDKMTPENCAKIAVKLDRHAEKDANISPDAILKILRTLLEEEYNLQLMQKSLKEMKIRKRRLKRNKVKPELSPPGREATVSFILDVQYIYL